MPTTISAQPDFAAQFQQVMFYLGPIAQILFWAILAFAVLWAAIQFKKLVDYLTSGASPSETADGGSTKKPSVDEFVE